MKRYILSLFILFCSVGLYAQNYNMSVSAPGVVATEVPFNVEFIIDEPTDDFQLPDFKGFEVIAGPTLSTSRSVTIINGKREDKSEYRYTCVLIAREPGNKVIGSATASSRKNKKYASRPLPIEVVKESEEGSSSTSAKGITKDDILVLVNVNKKTVYKGEPLIVTIKLATRVELAGLEGAKYPPFNGFWKQELKSSDRQWNRENINDKIYNTIVLVEYVLFPQRSGKLSVEPMSIDVVARVATASAQRRSVFDDFFGGGNNYQNIKRKIIAEETIINVLDLPSGAPHSFDGAVGDFKLVAKASSDMLSANSSGNVILTLSGSGNMPLLIEPKIDFPNSFEGYKVKTIDNYKMSVNGASGSKVFEYPFIARASGKYIVPSVGFSYFSPTKREYISIDTRPIDISISVDTTVNSEVGQATIYTGVTKDELKIIGTDIRYIDKTMPELIRKDSFLIGSFRFFAIVALMLAFTISVFVYLTKMRKAISDKVKVRSSKARKIALSRLKEGKVLMEKGKDSLFYQEILRAMLGYVGDKLNIEIALLTKINISDTLLSRGVEKQYVDSYIGVIEKCEMAQYATMANSSMADVYNQSIDVISNIEDKK